MEQNLIALTPAPTSLSRNCAPLQTTSLGSPRRAFTWDQPPSCFQLSKLLPRTLLICNSLGSLEFLSHHLDTAASGSAGPTLLQGTVLNSSSRNPRPPCVASTQRGSSTRAWHGSTLASARHQIMWLLEHTGNQSGLPLMLNY